MHIHIHIYIIYINIITNICSYHFHHSTLPLHYHFMGIDIQASSHIIQAFLDFLVSSGHQQMAEMGRSCAAMTFCNVLSWRTRWFATTWQLITTATTTTNNDKQRQTTTNNDKQQHYNTTNTMDMTDMTKSDWPDQRNEVGMTYIWLPGTPNFDPQFWSCAVGFGCIKSRKPLGWSALGSDAAMRRCFLKAEGRTTWLSLVPSLDKPGSGVRWETSTPDLHVVSLF